MATGKACAKAAGTVQISVSDSQAEPVLFGSIIKEHRKQARLSQKEFALRMNVTRNTVINWEADKSRPDYTLIPELCSLLHIRLHELFHMQPERALTDMEERILANLRQLSPGNRRVVEQMIRALASEELLAKDQSLKTSFALFLKRPGSLAAGTGSYVPEEAPEYVFLRRNHINARADGIALVDGDSMEPVYHSGDYIYYEETSDAQPGEDVLADTDDGAVIKRVNHDRTLYSVNPAIPYPAKSEDNTLVIRGRVLGVVSSSDRPAREDLDILEELFSEEIRAFHAAYDTKD